VAALSTRIWLAGALAFALLATRRLERLRIAACYLLGALGYSAVTDLPPGPLIVCAMTGLGLALFVAMPRRPA